MIQKRSSFNWKEISIVTLPFLVFNKFYGFRPIVESSLYDQFLSILYLGLLCWVVPELFRTYRKKSIALTVRHIVYVFVGSIIVAYFISGQSVYGSLRAIGPSLSICTFFLYLRNKISSKSIIQSFIILLVLYSIFYIISLLTFPNNIFGYSESLLERADFDIETRGIMRIGVPGADFVILAIFFVLNIGIKNKKYLIWLIPLFVLLIMRGTRTPLLITVLVSMFYIASKFKYKILIIIAAVLLYFSIPLIYDTFLNSKSDNIVVNYVKLTDKQLNEQEDEDIRVLMSKYYLFEYNDNLLQVIFGNGVPFGKSQYGKNVLKLQTTHSYHMNDVGYVQLFVQYGLIGVLLYLLLLYRVIRTNVDSKYEFAKMFVIYYFIVSVTGIYFVSNVMIMVFGLYLIEKNKKIV